MERNNELVENMFSVEMPVDFRDSGSIPNLPVIHVNTIIKMLNSIENS